MVKDYIFMILGTFLFAVSVTLFAMPNALAEGGIPGASLLLYYGFGLSPALMTFLLNTVIFIVGYRHLPKLMIIKSVLAIPLFSLFIYLLEDYGTRTGDPLLAAIYAGLFTGAGFGFIFRSGSTLGGSSTIAKMLNNRFGWELTGTNFAIDTLIVVTGIFIIGPVNTMYTIVALFIGKKVTDYILEGFESKKIIHIFTDETTKVEQILTERLSAHTTILEGRGGPNGDYESLLYVAVPKQQLFYLKKLVRQVDDDAFIVSHTVKDVSGGSFMTASHPTQQTFKSKKKEREYYQNEANQ
ncbi:YitT family protein [Corticicoccus populi]|uniref:YitT family protein n=1 Tax=Corticicoccus populi TaxID=1812821 RepID=A0ABW5WYL1_9STAP